MKIVVSALLLVGVSCVCSAQIERPTSGPILDKPVMATTFKWFDALDFYAVRTGQFVKVKLNSSYLVPALINAGQLTKSP